MHFKNTQGACLMPRKKKTPLKKSLSGLEIELFLLDSKGKPSNKADVLITKTKKSHPDIMIKKECSRQMFEVSSFPSVKVWNTSMNLIESLKKTIDIAEKNNLALFPFATYPGEVRPEIRKDKWYRLKEAVLTKECFKNAGLCCGVHYHYTLPRGIFNNNAKWLNPLTNSKIKQSMIDSYNTSIAVDPVMIGLLQSSPFFQGKHIGKDSRVIVYRGGRKLKYMSGVYSKFQIVGALPPYKQTLGDLLFSLKRRQLRWKQRMLKNNLEPSMMVKNGNVLQFSWNPVKINELGTLEQRSIDTNYISNIIAISSFLKFIHRRIQQDFLKVIPSDIGVEEPFKIEDNTMYIPPHTYVRNNLQKRAAYNGLADEKVYDYCSRFVKLGRSCILKGYAKAVMPLVDMINEKKTVSDNILKWFRRKGFDNDSKLTSEICHEFALQHFELMKKDLVKTEKTVHRLEGL